MVLVLTLAVFLFSALFNVWVFCLHVHMCTMYVPMVAHELSCGWWQQIPPVHLLFIFICFCLFVCF